MKIRKRFYASLLGGLIAAAVLALAPSATAFDPLEFPAAVDALNTYSPESLTPPTNDGAHDFAVGGGQHGAGFISDCSNSNGNCVNEGFSAQSGLLGENPQGRVSATFLTPHPFKLRGPVLCLDVNGNHAFILAMQTEDAAAVGFPKNQPFLLEVMDNGNPVMGTPPDLIRNRGPGDFLPGIPFSGFPCGEPLDPLLVPLLRGNIVVRDVT
jgi:hypothetical protein